MQRPVTIAFILGGVFFLLNIPLSMSGEGIRLYTQSVDSGWATRCTYYMPFKLYDITVQAGQQCDFRTKLH